MACYRMGIFVTLLLIAQTLDALGQSQTPAQPPQPSPPSISYGLVMDNSGSLRSRMGYLVAVGKAVINTNSDRDETFLVRFINSQQIEQVSDFTQDKTKLNKLIDGFYVAGGSTAINDAIYVSAQYLSKESKKEADRRQVLVLVTDGYDRSSYYSTETLLQFLRKNGTVVYVMAFTNLVKEEGGKSYQRALAYLETLASQTGGKAYFPKDRAELERHTLQMIDALRQQ